MANQSAGRSASRTQLIIIGALFVVLLGIVYFMFLRGGDEAEPTRAASPPAPVTAPEMTENEEEPVVPEKGKGPIETSEVLGGKDPFEAVLDLTPDTGGGEAAATETATSTDTGTTTPTDGTTTPTDGTTTTPPPVVTPPPTDDGGDDEPKTGWTVRLLTVYKDDGVEKVIVGVVNRQTDTHKTYKLVEGKRFARNFKLVSINNDDTASFLFGDEPFSLAENQKVTKK
ncbi:MAG: hypothetical protein M3124_07195 [Actinomycetota bacterium]|nr:hypothetical protein [Actinomycetota bacterium]